MDRKDFSEVNELNDLLKKYHELVFPQKQVEVTDNPKELDDQMKPLKDMWGHIHNLKMEIGDPVDDKEFSTSGVKSILSELNKK